MITLVLSDHYRFLCFQGEVFGSPSPASPTRRPGQRRPSQRRPPRQAPNEQEDFEDDDEGEEIGVGDEDVPVNDRTSLSTAFLKFVKSVKEMTADLADNWRGVKELTVVSGWGPCM